MISTRLINNRFTTNRLIREDDALLQFETMAWLIRCYGAPVRPNVPSPLHKSPTLENLRWDPSDSRSVFDWAEDSFGAIKSDCHMDDWDLSVIPAGDSVDPDSVLPTRVVAQANTQRPHYVDLHGRPVLFYDPARCGEAGYFTARAILRLAELRSAAFESEIILSPLMTRIITLTAASYSRQGFALANVTASVSDFLTSDTDMRSIPERVLIDTLCFSTCLALRIRHQSEGMILATYGTRMPKAFRKKVRLACRQIDAYEQDLKLLQIMSEPRAHHAVNPARYLQDGTA